MEKEKKQVNYKRIFAIQGQLEKQVRKACPTMDNKSGIYFYTREDEDGKKYAYIGQAQNLLSRSASHLQGWNQRIDVSLKKRKFYSIDNPYGWKLNFLHFPEKLLNEKEKYYIKLYMDAGYELYNVESGSKVSKVDINERKLGLGYHDGIKAGKKALRRDLNHIIDKYLTITLKSDGVRAKNALDKFYKLLSEPVEEDNKEKNEK